MKCSSHHRTPTLAAHHWSIHHLELPEACDQALADGYQGLDLAIGDLGSGPRIELSQLADSNRECTRLAAVADEKGIVFTDFVAAALNGFEQPERSRRETFHTFVRFCRNAHLLGLQGVTILPGEYEVDYEEGFQTLAAELRKYVEAGGESNLAVSIEPHLRSVTDTPERTLRMLQAVPGLTLTLDYSHFIYSGHSQAEVEPLHVYARHFHIRQAAPGQLAAPVDQGVIDFRRVITHLNSIGYRGALTMEYVESSWYAQDAVDVPRENAAMLRVIQGILDDAWNAC